MSLVRYLEKTSVQEGKRYLNQPLSNGKRLDIIESILYATFKRKGMNNLNPRRLPKQLLGVELNWLSSDGTVEMIRGSLKRTRNYNAIRKGPGGMAGEFAVKKSAFGSGVQPELRVPAGETRVLRSGVKHDYKRIILEDGAKIVSDKAGSMLILLASEELIMGDKSRIEWMGMDGVSQPGRNTDPSLDGSPAQYVFNVYNGDFISIKDENIISGESGKGDNPGTAGESGGIIWIEAKKFKMGKNAAIRSIGGEGGSSQDGNGAGGNGGLVVIKTQIGIGIEERKISVTPGRSAGMDGFDGVKDVEFLK